MKQFAWITSALLLCGGAYAQSGGSGGGSFANAFLIPEIVCNAGSFGTACTGNGGGGSILFGDIKVPSSTNKNVLVMASLEDSILTNTLVASKNGTRSTTSASGSIRVTPHVFPCIAPGSSPCSVLGTEVAGAVTPSAVTFAKRTQTLSATLSGLNCTIDTTTGLLTCTDPETIDLILDTTNADAFNFLVQTPGAGVYQIQLQISVTASATSDSVQAGAQVTVAVAAGSLVEMIVNAETPFDTIKACGATPNSGGPNPCGP